MSSSLRSVPRFLPVALLLVLASTLAVLQVVDLEATSEATSESASAVPAVPQEPEPIALGSCVVHGIRVCDLCRPCPENCIQLCSFPDICECGCVGCIDEGGL